MMGGNIGTQDVSYPILKYDVKDIKGKTIAKKGQELSPDFIHSLRKIRPPIRISKFLNNFPDILDDFREYCNSSPYDKIFDTEESCRETVTLLSRARIFPVVYESLQYFKDNDMYTYKHTLMLSALATHMANDFSSVYKHTLEAASVTPCHDFGKVNIPLDILTKRDALTVDEIDIVRDHVSAGFVLLTYFLGEEDPISCKVAYEHHELIDGSGYPRGIRENDELVQIVTVCDMFDALVSPRPYRTEQYSIRGALEMITDAASSGKINLDCTKLLISYNRANKPPIDKVVLSTEHRERQPKNNNYSLGQTPETNS